MDDHDQASPSEQKPLVPTRAGHAVVAAVALGVVLRLVVRDGVSFSPADEGRYLAMARTIAVGGLDAYPELIAEYLRNDVLHAYPSPLRYAYVLLSALACNMLGGPSFAALARLSTAAGLVTVGATALLASRIGGPRHGAIAAFLIALSPLQLALGRRALQDELVVAACTVMLLAFTHVKPSRWFFSAESRAPAAIFVAAATLFLALKETSVLLYATVVAVAVVDAVERRSTWGRAALVLAPPVLAVLGFLAVGGTLAQGLELVELSAASADLPYVRAFMAGPPQRVIVDLFLLVPCTVAFAMAALGAPPGGRTSSAWRLAATFAVVTLVVATGLPKNVRFTAVLEPVLAVYAADALLAWSDRQTTPRRRATVLGAGCTLSAIASWAIFTRVFLERGVYDPTTVELLAALDGVPHGGAMSAGTLPGAVVAVAACVTAALVAWGAGLGDEA
jgi:hypothetical protein